MSEHVATYVDEVQYERWQEQADEMGMSMSDWTQAMVEAGAKKFDRDVQPNDSKDEIRRQRDDLRKELSRARDRIKELERQVHLSERQAIVEYVEENSGAEYQDVVQHVVNTANSRVTKILDELEGDEIEIDKEGRMYEK